MLAAWIAGHRHGAGRWGLSVPHAPSSRRVFSLSFFTATSITSSTSSMARMNLRTASQRKPPAKFLETGFLVKPTAKSTSNGSASQASGPVRAERNNAAARISPASSALTSLPPSRAPTPPRSPNSTRLATLRQRPVRSSRTAAKTTRGNGNSPLKVQAAAQRARASSRDESEDQEDDDAGHEASRASGSRPMPFVLIEPGQINRQGECLLWTFTKGHYMRRT